MSLHSLETLANSSPESPELPPDSEPSAGPELPSEASASTSEARPDLPSGTKRKLGQAVLAADQLPASPDAESAPVDKSPTSPDEEEQTYAEQVLADIARWRDWYDDDERSFIGYSAKVHPKTPEEKSRYIDRLLRAEHDAAFNWQQMQASTREAVNEHIIPVGQYSIAYAQRYGEGINPGDTIEATSAILYDERIQTLSAAIKDSPDLTDEERRSELDQLRNTWSVVYAYIESTDDLYHDHSGQLRRNQCHNNMIRHLNQINDLARKYNTTPLTFRNFMPNDTTFGYQSHLDKGGALWHKAEFDREIVASYFRKVFAKEFARENAARAARQRYMR